MAALFDGETVHAVGDADEVACAVDEQRDDAQCAREVDGCVAVFVGAGAFHWSSLLHLLMSLRISRRS